MLKEDHCQAAVLCREAARVIAGIKALTRFEKAEKPEALKRVLLDSFDQAQINPKGVRTRLEERLEAITRYAQYAPARSAVGAAFLMCCYIHRQLAVNLETTGDNDMLEDYFLHALDALDNGTSQDLTTCRDYLFPTDVLAYNGEATMAVIAA